MKTSPATIVGESRNRVWVIAATLSAIMVLVITSACDPEGGPQYRIVNESAVGIRVYIDILPQEYVDKNDNLIKQFTAFESRIGSFGPIKTGERTLGYVVGLPLETLLVITATADDGDIVYQKSITLENLSGAVITISLD